VAKVKTTLGRTLELKMSQLVGRRVRIVRSLSNAFGRFPAGTLATVSGHWQSGVNLEFDACERCGFQPRITKVHRDLVILVEDEGTEIPPIEPRRRR